MWRSSKLHPATKAQSQCLTGLPRTHGQIGSGGQPNDFPAERRKQLYWWFHGNRTPAVPVGSRVWALLRASQSAHGDKWRTWTRQTTNNSHRVNIGDELWKWLLAARCSMEVSCCRLTAQSVSTGMVGSLGSVDDDVQPFFHDSVLTVPICSTVEPRKGSRRTPTWVNEA